MPSWTKKRALITVRTYPAPSSKAVEASCTAGVLENDGWIRLFPIPYRLMTEEQRFRKWQWIEVEALKASNDQRPESFKVNLDSIVAREMVGTADGWRQRRKLLEPLRRTSMCQIREELKKNGAPTLGFFRPFRINRLIIQATNQAEWTEKEKADLQGQGDLFQKAPEQLLEKIPLEFRYEFRCGDIDCSGHNMMCTDWEMIQAYRKWRDEYGQNWEVAFRQRFEFDMINKTDTHFFVGTLHQYPDSWIIVGLFYPPPKSRDLFDAD